MSKTNDRIFAKEFKNMMNTRKSMLRGFKISDIPLPELPSMISGVPKLKRAIVRGVTELFFERLNDTEVDLLGRISLKKRQVLSDGTFRKDKDGKYVTDSVTIPNDSVAVVSDISIGLKRRYEKDGRIIDHKVSEGFRYVDYFEANGKRKYIYIIPRKYVYRLNLCALVLTPNRRRIYHKGCKLSLVNGNYIYLYVTPYTYRDNLDVRVLGVKSTYNFDKEVKTLLDYWMQHGVVFDLNLTALDEQINGVTNLGIETYEGTITSEDFLRYDKSLAEEKDEDLFEDG